MCNRTDCAGVWAGQMACARCEEVEMGKNLPCVVCNAEDTDEFIFYRSDDYYDPPFRAWLCRNHQSALIGPVQEAVRKMREEREAQCQ